MQFKYSTTTLRQIVMAISLSSCGLVTEPKSTKPDFQPTIPYKSASPELDVKNTKSQEIKNELRK